MLEQLIVDSASLPHTQKIMIYYTKLYTNYLLHHKINLTRLKGKNGTIESLTW